MAQLPVRAGVLRRDAHGLLAVRSVKALAFVALGAVLAYTVAIVAITDWLEIDWSFKPEDETGRKGLRQWGNCVCEEWLAELDKRK